MRQFLDRLLIKEEMMSIISESCSGIAASPEMQILCYLMAQPEMTPHLEITCPNVSEEEAVKAFALYYLPASKWVVRDFEFNFFFLFFLYLLGRSRSYLSTVLENLFASLLTAPNSFELQQCGA